MKFHWTSVIRFMIIATVSIASGFVASVALFQPQTPFSAACYGITVVSALAGALGAVIRPWLAT